MSKKRLVLSLGHKDLGTNLPEQKAAVAKTAPIIADFVEEATSATTCRTDSARNFCPAAFISASRPS